MDIQNYKKRYDWLDALRGIAIILVILGHVIGGLEQFGGGNGHYLRQIVYSFHMPLMFMISGYVVKNYTVDKENASSNVYLSYISDFIKKTLLSLYVPYLIWGYLFWAVKYFIYAGNESVTLTDGLNLFWNCSAWVPGWYLLALLFIRIMDMLMQLANLELKYQGIFWLLLYILGGFADIYLISNICGFGVFFFVGRCLRNKHKFTGWEAALCFVMFIAGTALYINDHSYYGKFCIGISVSIALVSLFSRYDLSNRTLSLLGKNSMIPYVLHAYFTIPFRIILNRAGCSQLYIYVIVESVAAVILSVAVMVMIDKVRFFNKFILLFYPARKKS